MLLIPASAAGVVAPAHATVVSTLAKLTTPGTDALETDVCARPSVAEQATTAAAMKIRTFITASERGRQRVAAFLRAVHGDDARGRHVGVGDQVRDELLVNSIRRAVGRHRQLTGEELRRD